MEKFNLDFNKYLLSNTRSFKDYFLLIRSNIRWFTAIFLLMVTVSVLYALLSEKIYQSIVSLKINVQKQSVLDSKNIAEQSDASDRFIANEIEIIDNYDSREKFAIALLDSFQSSSNKDLFRIIANAKSGSYIPKMPGELATVLKDVLNIEQVSGLDIVQVSAESPSAFEAALIANTVAEKYRELNLDRNRNQLSSLRMFLAKQTEEKSNELEKVENELKEFQQRGGIVSLDVQSNALINQLAELDAQKDGTKIDLLTSNEILNQYKKEIGEQDPHLVDYLESISSQGYIDALQKQITEYQMNKDLALSNKSPNMDISSKLNEYDKKIVELKQKLNTEIKNIKAGAYSSSPEQIRELTQKLIEEKIKNNALLIKYSEVQKIITDYESNLNRLPGKSIELAQYQRKRESLQQVFSLIEQKYQEALINELSQPGNVVIVGKGRIPHIALKPNRILIILGGIVLGFAFSFGFVIVKDYFDDTLKTPEDIEAKDFNLLAWVPHLKYSGEDYYRNHEVGTPGPTDSILKESFKSIRARIQFSSKSHPKPFKTILVTSPAAAEGKTMIAVNLATSYVKTERKTLLIDCDLIRPKVHTIMGVKRSPGLSDFLANRNDLEDIINKTRMNDLDYITAGSFVQYTDKLLDSAEMKNFLEQIKVSYDIIIIDSAPIIPVIDTQILARLIDTSLLVVSSRRTENKLMTDTMNLIKNDNLPFLGVIFNNFDYRNGYHYYHKYYYNYSSNGKNQKNGEIKV